MLNFDYAIAVGFCTVVVLIGLRAAVPLMRSASRRRTDALLLRIQVSDQEGNKSSASAVAVAEESTSSGLTTKKNSPKDR